MVREGRFGKHEEAKGRGWEELREDDGGYHVASPSNGSIPPSFPSQGTQRSPDMLRWALSLTATQRPSSTGPFLLAAFAQLHVPPAVIRFLTSALGPPCFDNPFGPFLQFNYPQISTCTSPNTSLLQLGWEVPLLLASLTGPWHFPSTHCSPHH